MELLKDFNRKVYVNNSYKLMDDRTVSCKYNNSHFGSVCYVKGR